jgi:hypothetical protein
MNWGRSQPAAPLFKLSVLNLCRNLLACKVDRLRPGFVSRLRLVREKTPQPIVVRRLGWTELVHALVFGVLPTVGFSFERYLEEPAQPG